MYSDKIINNILGKKPCIDKKSKNSKKMSKVFNINTEEGLKNAEQYQEYLYNNYYKVGQTDLGYGMIELYGEDKE